MQSTSLRVPFLDLSRELIQIRSQIQDEFNRITFEQTNFILGKEVSNFEQQFAKYIDVEHCVSVGNGTDATNTLSTAGLTALELGPVIRQRLYKRAVPTSEHKVGILVATVFAFQ